MIRRSFAVALAVAGCCVLEPSAADADAITREVLEETGEVEAGPAVALARPDVFSSPDGATMIHGLPALTLLDGRRFTSATELGRMGMRPVNLFPVAFLSAIEVGRVGASPVYGSDGPGGVINLRSTQLYTGGEAGFLYGRSGGKYGAEQFSTYIIGGVGNDKFNITVGAAYTETTWQDGRRRRLRD